MWADACGPDANGTNVAGSQDPLDLLDALSRDSGPTSTPGLVVSSPQDPFSESGADNAVFGPGQGSSAVQIEGDLDQWFWGLATKDKGVIYEDTLMQVHPKIVIQHHQNYRMFLRQ